MSELNERIKRPDVNELWKSVHRKVRSVFSDIGYEFVCEPRKIHAQVVNGRWQIADEVVKIYDVGESLNCFRPGYEIGRPGNFSSRLVYSKTPFELIFNENFEGTVIVSAYCFYKDENEELMIPEDAYEACFDSCLYDGIYNLNNPQHPLWQERAIMKQTADSSIFKARGRFAEVSIARARTYNRFI